MRTFVLSACLLLFSAARPVSADPLKPAPPVEEEKEELRPARLWHLAALPAWYLAWISVHEGSHALAIDAYGYEIAAFRPYPHFMGDRFYLGAVIFNHCTEGKTLVVEGRSYPCEMNRGEPLIFIAPYLTDMAMFAATDALLATGAVDPDSPAGAMLYVGGMLVPWLDFTYNMNNLYDGDREAFQRYTGLSRKTVVLTSEVISIIGAWRLYEEGKRVFYDRAPARSERGWTLAPLQTESGLGLGVSGRW